MRKMKSLQKISGKIAKEILPELLEKGGSPAKIVDERGLGMISDPAAITVIGEELVTAHPEEVEASRGSKTKLQWFFVGQLMKKTGGKAALRRAKKSCVRSCMIDHHLGVIMGLGTAAWVSGFV